MRAVQSLVFLNIAFLGLRMRVEKKKREGNSCRTTRKRHVAMSPLRD